MTGAPQFAGAVSVHAWLAGEASTLPAESTARTVIDPRGVLREFGLELPRDIEVRVWDSTAELRYLVLPERPAGAENMSEEQLATLVTRDAMVGVARVTLPPCTGTTRFRSP